MPIVLLPEDTKGLISSTLVLNDAISVVKELIDNALDSRATNIVVEISLNTLDVIQVKDNGIGIGIEDRQLLCKRGLTSKIRTISDLAQLGGTSLGFRGEALASIAALSDSVIITTRVDGETVASTLKHDRSGKLIGSSSASHGTGTTVRVQDFLKPIPVRKQTALKQTARTLLQLKRLLFDYAYARPTIRFLLKVLKAKNENGNWSYIPCKDGSNLSEVCSKIAGKEVAAMCNAYTVSSINGRYNIHAFLLSHPGADLSKAIGSGQHISIDGRPISSERGNMKDLVKMYRCYLQNLSSDEVRIPLKPYLYVRFNCPRGSYDVNIDPAKDEVMFEDWTLILGLFETVLLHYYGEMSSKDPTPKKQEQPSTEAQTATSSFDLFLARKKPPLTDIEQTNNSLNALPPESVQVVSDFGGKAGAVSSHTSSLQSEIGSSIGKLPSYSTMYNLNDEEATEITPTVIQEDDIVSDEDEDIRDPRIINPFTLAKFNTRSATQPLSLKDASNPRKDLVCDSLSVQNSAERSVHQTSASPVHSDSPRFISNLPTPGRSPTDVEPYQNPGPPHRPWKRRAESTDDDEISENSETAQDSRDSQPQPTLIDTWTKAINSQNSTGPFHLARHGNEIDRSLLQPHESSESPKAGGIIPSPSSSPVKFRKHQPKPFQSPLKKQGQPSLLSSSERMQPIASSLSMGGVPTMAPSPSSFDFRSSARSPGSASPHRLPNDQADLDDIMDFEIRKRDAVIQQRRSKQTRAGQTDVDKGVSTKQFIVPSRPQNEGRPLQENEDYASRFEDIPIQPASASYTQNPHWNRQVVATRNLDEPRAARKMVEDARTGLNTFATSSSDRRNSSPEKVDDSNGTISPASDPRAYLIRQQNMMTGKNKDNDHASNKTLKRSKTAQLPFEAIPVAFATYQLIAEPILDESIASTPSHILECVRRLSRVDTYVKTGQVGYVKWKDFALGSSMELLSWESRLKSLIRTHYRAKPFPTIQTVDADTEGNERGEEQGIEPQIEIALGKAIRAHVEQDFEHIYSVKIS